MGNEKELPWWACVLLILTTVASLKACSNSDEILTRLDQAQKMSQEIQR